MAALTELLLNPTYWHWFIAAIILLIFELLLPTTYLMWTAIGAFLAGLVLLLLPGTSWEMQLVLFGLFSVVSIVAGKKWLKNRPIETDEPLLNRRGEQYIGRVVTLTHPIVNGVGHVSIDDTRWRIEGPDLDAGGQVSIVAVDGTSLVVEARP